MAIKLKTKTGKVVDYPVSKVKKILSAVGFTGLLLTKATGNVFSEAKKLTKKGVITATNFEKAVVKAVSNTNRIAVNTVQRMTKKVLK